MPTLNPWTVDLGMSRDTRLRLSISTWCPIDPKPKHQDPQAMATTMIISQGGGCAIYVLCRPGWAESVTPALKHPDLFLFLGTLCLSRSCPRHCHHPHPHAPHHPPAPPFRTEPAHRDLKKPILYCYPTHWMARFSTCPSAANSNALLSTLHQH